MSEPKPLTAEELAALLAFMKCLAPFSCDRKGEGACYVCEAKDALSQQAATIAERDAEIARLSKIERDFRALFSCGNRALTEAELRDEAACILLEGGKDG